MGNTPKPTQSPATSPAKGKAAVTRKPARRGTKRAGRQPPPKKGARGKGRGQKKTYEDPRVQAAYERQRELRELFSTVSSAVKPALEEIADRSAKKLIEDPEAHKGVPEYQELRQLLDDQLKRAIETADREHRTRLGIAERTYELESIRIRQTFDNSFDYGTEEFFDGSLNRASIVDELRREGCTLDTPDLSYTYVDNIPYVSCKSSTQPEEQARKTKPAVKRKAEGQPDGQASSKVPRHPAGLLASEMQPDGIPESSAPSPTPFEEQESTFTSKKRLPDLPSCASEPDAFGVRSVDRPVKQLPTNRFIVPQTFQWDDDEIGFRDSTNDSTRKSKRNTRGIFLDRPNSRNFHLDHTVKDYDCREYKEDTLNPELVKKHSLHPRLGFFLSSSANEAEPAGEFMDGLRPVVHVPDSTTTYHTSRSVRAKKMDAVLEKDAAKIGIANGLAKFCREEHITPADIVSDEMLDRERQARERISVSSSDAASDVSDHSSPTEADDTLMKEGTSLLLQAADHLETDKSALQPPSPRHSRPYDAVRDVFTSAEPAPVTVEQPSEGAHFGLSILADVAGESLREITQTEKATGMENAMIDPRILNQAPAPSNPSNAFLQTALNPTSGFTRATPSVPIAPSVPSHPPSMEVAPQPAPTKNPFTTQPVRDSPVLPPLRPRRPDGIGKGPVIMPHQPPLQPAHRPLEFDSHRGPVHTNSGAFYPPAPSRPYHQGFAFHEPHPMSVPIQGQPISRNANYMNQPPMYTNRPIYSTLSPPPMQGQAYMPLLPAQMEVPFQSDSSTMPPTQVPSPPINSPRQRGSVSSNGNGSNKYRKIAAAPVPHNRSWQSSGGPELRLSHYDYRESIKDYRANETPPQSGPTTIRGWNVNNVSKGRNKGLKKEDSEEKDPPHTISPFISKWNASDRN